MLYSRSLLFACFIYSSMYVLIPNSYLSLPPPPLFPLVTMFVFYVCEAISVL